MTDTTADAAAGPRIFLTVVDESDEYRIALRYACRRALHTGGKVALLYVIEPDTSLEWMAVEHLAQAERREAAEQLLHKLAAEVNRFAGSMPSLYVREGKRTEQLTQLLDEDPAISILVLGAGTGSEGPGPLVQHFTGRMAGRLRVPVTIVPGSLTAEQVDALA